MSLNEDQTTFMMTVLKHSPMTPDWKAIAVEVGITRSDNAATKFRAMLKGIGYGFVNGQVATLEDIANGTTTAGNITATTTTPPTGRKRKSPVKKTANGAGGKKKAKTDEPTSDATEGKEAGKADTEAEEA